MNYWSPPKDAASLYAGVYSGAIVKYSALTAMVELVRHARSFVEERLAPHDPVEIHRHVPADRLGAQLGEAQRGYASAAETRRLWRALFAALGLDLEDTARDRLMLRFQVHSEPGSTAPWARSTATVGFHRAGEIIAFSSAHAHAGIPNHTGLTRISLETRTVSIADVRAGRGAANVDGAARWVAPGLFRRLSDEEPLSSILKRDRLVSREAW